VGGVCGFGAGRVVARRFVAWVAAVVVLQPVVAAAQTYPRLHIAEFLQQADRATVEPDGVFSVTIHVKIAQRRDRLDELILGSFDNCEIISNETVRTVLPNGTDFVERLTVQAQLPGEATISPAYIDANDPARGKPMRFSSNAIRVRVLGSAPFVSAMRTLGATVRRLLSSVTIVAGLFAAAFVLIVLFFRRRRKPARVPAVAVTQPVAAAPPVKETTGRERLAQAAQAYRRDRSEGALVDVRSVLFGLSGAGSGATLLDALRALGERSRDLRAALLAAEAAAFGPAAERDAAGDRMLAAIDAYVQPQTVNGDAWTR
jgi:hypothetical protein